MNFWHVFDAAASRFAERTAIEVQKHGTLETHTYRQLRAVAQTRASWLAAHGIQAGDRCAILGDNDAWWCGAYLGILRYGAVAVPLDTNYSAEQVRTIVRDAGARVVLVNERLQSLATDAVGDLEVLVAALQPEAALHVADAPDAPDTPSQSPAVILYTSGTTADPKGVVLSHANLIAERDAAFRVIAVSEDDSVLGVLPLFHALAQLANLLLPFAVGARVVFLETLSSGELLRALSERRITIFACVPQFFYLIHQRVFDEIRTAGWPRRMLFRQLLTVAFAMRRHLRLNLGALLFARVHARLGKQMRLFLTGGSKFDPSVGRDFFAMGFTILQAYGLTETSGAATLTQPHDAYLDTVGRALPGQEVKVLAADDGEVDGEIAIKGPIVMQGYFNRPDATAEVIKDGWFLSGDLGRFDSVGRLTITGRRKEVIVLSNGKNIYPEEIEAQYRKSPFVKEICVLGLKRQHEPAAERLYAVVVPDQELLRQRRIANAGDLLRFEMEGQAIHLPPHKRVLGYEVWFEPLPRTTTGKLKRHEVERRLRRDGGAPASGFVAADDQWADDAQSAAALEIIRARVPGAAIRPSSNLELDLGLDSLERVELLTELEQRFGATIDRDRAHEIFTVRHLVDALSPSPTGEALRPAEPSWSLLLNAAAAGDDRALRPLTEDRPLAVPLFFLCSRLLRLVLGPSAVQGRQRLPDCGPYIISPNHQGYLDPFIVCSVLPYRVFKDLFFVGAAEYFETPLTRWLAKKINLLPVDPDANLISAMQASAYGLKRGKILMLFPEGERSIDGTVRRFKKGVSILAQHLDVPVVPVAVRGSYEMWPRNRAINWRALLPFGHRVRVAFGPPIRFAPSSGYGESASQLRDAVVRMWDAI